LLTDERIHAVSFVGLNANAEYIYAKQASGTRSEWQALGGAKNHMLVMPDAESKQVSFINGDGYGQRGERCMADFRLRFVSATDVADKKPDC